MTMFAGQFKQRKGRFDFSPETYGTPGIGDGLPGATPMGEPGLGFGAPPAAPASKFGVRDVIGIVGEALGGAAGNGPGAYTQMKLREREIARQHQQAQITRQQAMQDWVAKQRYERENPAPRAPHYWEMNDGSLGVVGPDGKPQVVYKDPTPKINWIKADNGDGTQSLIPVGPNGPIEATGGAVPSPQPSVEPDIILNRARQQGFISPGDRALIEKQLGPNGRTALDGWLTSSKVKTGQQVGGKMYYQVNGKWYDNPEGR